MKKKNKKKIKKQCVACLGSNGFTDAEKCKHCGNHMCSQCAMICPMPNCPM